MVLLARSWSVRRRPLLAAIVCVLGTTSRADAQMPAARRDPVAAPGASVPGFRLRVLGAFDDMTGAPIEGVEVFSVGSGMSSNTTKTGTVSLVFVPEGKSLIRLRKVGYEAQMLTVSISPADTVPLTIMMSHGAQELPAVTTRDASTKYLSPALRGFEERRKTSAAGYFTTDSVLRAEESRGLGNVLRTHAPTLVVKEGSGGLVHVWAGPQCSQLSSRGGPSSGVPAVYLDAVPLHTQPTPDGGGFVLPAGLNVSDLQAIEWYPSTDMAPAEFPHTVQACGALLLWTRER